MKKVFILCLMAFVICSCVDNTAREQRKEQRFIADSLAKREKIVADSLDCLPIREQLLFLYGEKIVAKYESYESIYTYGWSNHCRYYMEFDHYNDRDDALFYCEQLKKAEPYIDFSIKTKYINELHLNLNEMRYIKYLQKTYELYVKYGCDVIVKMTEEYDIYEVEKILKLLSY